MAGRSRDGTQAANKHIVTETQTECDCFFSEIRKATCDWQTRWSRWSRAPPASKPVTWALYFACACAKVGTVSGVRAPFLCSAPIHKRSACRGLARCAACLSRCRCNCRPALEGLRNDRPVGEYSVCQPSAYSRVPARVGVLPLVAVAPLVPAPAIPHGRQRSEHVPSRTKPGRAKALGGTVTRWQPVKDGTVWHLRIHIAYP